MRDEILFGDLFRARIDDRGAAILPVLFLDLDHVVADQEVDLAGVRKQVDEVLDALRQLFVFVFDLVALELGESPQLEVEHGLCLPVAHLPRLRHQLRLRVVRRGSAADRRDDLVEIAEGDQVAEQDVLALARLLELVLRAAANDVAPVVDVGLEHLLEAHRLRLAGVERHHVHRKR